MQRETRSLSIPIYKITILRQYDGPDIITFDTALAPNMPGLSAQSEIHVDVESGTGEKWLMDNFGVSPDEIISC